MKKLRIALLASAASVHARRWANALAGRGHELHLITQHRGGDALSAEVNVRHLPFHGRPGYFLNAPFLRQYLKQLEPDLLHAHYASGYGTLGRLSAFHPYVLSVWGSDVYDFPNQSKLKLWLLRGNLGAADVLASTSCAMAKQTQTLRPGLPEIRITPFGIDTRQFKPGPSRGDGETINIGTVKGLTFTYGIDTLIKGFALARASLIDRDQYAATRLKLLIVGGGADKRQLERLAESLGVAEVTEFTGAVPHAVVPNYLNRLDVFVAASRNESFGVAILEASACALPVIVSDVGGLPEVVEDGVTGRVIRSDAPEALAGVIEELALSRELRERMGNAGMRRVIDHYSWDKCVSIVEQLYQDVAP